MELYQMPKYRSRSVKNWLYVIYIAFNCWQVFWLKWWGLSEVIIMFKFIYLMARSQCYQNFIYCWSYMSCYYSELRLMIRHLRIRVPISYLSGGMSFCNGDSRSSIEDCQDHRPRDRAYIQHLWCVRTYGSQLPNCRWIACLTKIYFHLIGILA